MIKRVHIVGAGGVGFWLAVALCREGIDFTVHDDDTLRGGLGASRLPAADPDTYKVDLLRGFLLVSMGMRAPGPRVFKTRVVPETGFDSEDLVVDCTDMEPVSRKVLWDAIKARGARIIRVSYDGAQNMITVAEGLPLRSGGGGYAATPSLALSLAAGGIGALVVRKIVDGYDGYIDFQITVEELIKEAMESIEREMS